MCNIHSSLNYDVAFPGLKEEDLPACLKEIVSHRTAAYCEYDKDNDTVGDPITCNLYKVRPRGVIKRRKEVTKADSMHDGYVKHRLIQWSNRTGGVFFIQIYGIDRYGRIEADLLDPVTGVSFAHWLIENFPEYYRFYG
jgi:hypothetical protein